MLVSEGHESVWWLLEQLWVGKNAALGLRDSRLVVCVYTRTHVCIGGGSVQAGLSMLRGCVWPQT